MVRGKGGRKEKQETKEAFDVHWYSLLLQTYTNYTHNTRHLPVGVSIPV